MLHIFKRKKEKITSIVDFTTVEEVLKKRATNRLQRLEIEKRLLRDDLVCVEMEIAVFEKILNN